MRRSRLYWEMTWSLRVVEEVIIQEDAPVELDQLAPPSFPSSVSVPPVTLQPQLATGGQGESPSGESSIRDEGRRSFRPKDKKRREDKRRRSEGQSHSVEIAVCPRCGGRHAGQCLAGQRVCYQCRRPGHFVRQCPFPVAPACPRSGKENTGCCLTGRRVCYRCRQPGHFARQCPTLLAGPGPGPAPAPVPAEQTVRDGQARVVIATQTQTEASQYQ